MPEISALTSTYNSAGFFAETFESILKQTFEDFEFIVVDDCSTDDTMLRTSERYDYMTRVVEEELNIVVTPEQISE